MKVCGAIKVKGVRKSKIESILFARNWTVGSGSFNAKGCGRIQPGGRRGTCGNPSIKQSNMHPALCQVGKAAGKGGTRGEKKSKKVDRA